MSYWRAFWTSVKEFLGWWWGAVLALLTLAGISLLTFITVLKSLGPLWQATLWIAIAVSGSILVYRVGQHAWEKVEKERAGLEKRFVPALRLEPYKPEIGDTESLEQWVGIEVHNDGQEDLERCSGHLVGIARMDGPLNPGDLLPGQAVLNWSYFSLGRAQAECPIPARNSQVLDVAATSAPVNKFRWAIGLALYNPVGPGSYQITVQINGRDNQGAVAPILERYLVVYRGGKDLTIKKSNPGDA
ncbi:MAG: hypothetical protein HW403_860 [Dehalococcoidia bacterium]|nr:hypothetical protein [Dehalococcoidia bacterium]